MAHDPSWPLLERVKYLAIFSSNLDEFFMKRVGGLQRQRTGNVSDVSLDGLTVQEQLDAIRRHVEPMLAEHARCWQNDLEPALAREGIAIRTYAALGDDDRAVADDYFRKHVFPILTPLAVDPGHPFPFISNLSKSLGVMLEHPGRAEPSWVRIKVPENLPRWVPLPDQAAFRSAGTGGGRQPGTAVPGDEGAGMGDVPRDPQRRHRDGRRRRRRFAGDGRAGTSQAPAGQGGPAGTARRHEPADARFHHRRAGGDRRARCTRRDGSDRHGRPVRDRQPGSAGTSN